MKIKAERVGKTYLHFMNRNTKPKSKCLIHIPLLFQSILTRAHCQKQEQKWKSDF
jgi:hypothetical protein